MTRYRCEPKAPVGRPRSPLDVAEARELARIAGLAGNVLISLRRAGRGMYDSERELRRFLDEDGTAYSASDLAPALALLEATLKIGRHAAKPNVSCISRVEPPPLRYAHRSFRSVNGLGTAVSILICLVVC